MDTFETIAAERRRLADELDRLSADEWQQPSLCAGWSNHVVGAHLNLAWSVSTPAFAIGVLKARGNIDRAMDRFSRQLADRFPSTEWPSMLRANAGHRFTPPGVGPEAPLTDVVVHGADILRSVGRSVDVGPDALRTVLTFLTSSRARSPFRAASVDGLVLEATDVDLRIGSGPQVVSGPALSLGAALLRRSVFLADLDGPGAAVLAERVAA